MNKGGRSPIVGIDLGTTMSAVAVLEGENVVFIRNALGETLTPSVVARDSRNRGLVAGRTAKDIIATDPNLGAALFKRGMGGDQTYSVGDRPFTAVELSAFLLDQLRADAERQLGVAVDRCVVTVPAYFDESQRHATQQAAEMAGFHVERILNEPTAAAIAHGMHSREGECEFVVLDLGGGTFDVCVMERFEDLLEVRGVAGISQLGGEDFTEALCGLALRAANVEPERIDAHSRAVLLRRTELLKRKLTRWPGAELEVPTGEEGVSRRVTISADDMEAAFAPLLERMVAPCRSALRGSGLASADVKEVILVGGATRMRCVHRLAEQVFGITVHQPDEPDLLVAKGAAIQAALCDRDESVGDLMVTDVTSHTLGISVSRDVFGKQAPGYFAPLIERNTVIPVSRVDRFSTTEPNQTRLTISVFEGEGRMVKDNREIGSLEIAKIPRGPSRDVVDVCFTYDLNGLLQVEVTVLETGKVHSKLFQRGAALSGDQLERAADRLRRLKADPSERPRHRDLIARANALWSDVGGASREELSLAIDTFEATLGSREVPAIDAAYTALLEVCESIDEGERW